MVRQSKTSLKNHFRRFNQSASSNNYSLSANEKQLVGTFDVFEGIYGKIWRTK